MDIEFNKAPCLSLSRIIERERETGSFIKVRVKVTERQSNSSSTQRDGERDRELCWNNLLLFLAFRQGPAHRAGKKGVYCKPQLELPLNVRANGQAKKGRRIERPPSMHRVAPEGKSKKTR